MSKKNLVSLPLIVSLGYNLLKIINLFWKPIVNYLNKNKIEEQYKNAEEANNEKDVEKLNDILKS